MKIIVDGKEIKEDSLDDLFKTSDNSTTKTTGQGPHKGDGRKENIPQLTREMAAVDAIILTQKETADIHGITQTSVNNYTNGRISADSAPDVELTAVVESTRHKIENKAVAALMATLNLFDPSGLENQMEVVNAAGKLSSIVEKIKGREKNDGNNVHLHLYAPRMKRLEDYETVEVN